MIVLINLFCESNKRKLWGHMAECIGSKMIRSHKIVGSNPTQSTVARKIFLITNRNKNSVLLSLGRTVNTLPIIMVWELTTPCSACTVAVY